MPLRPHIQSAVLFFFSFIASTFLFGDPLPGTRLSFVQVPAGEFQMGDKKGDIDEKPVHTVSLSNAFWIATTETTNADYDLFLKESGYDGAKEASPDYLRHHRDWSKDASPAAGHPVACVSWHNAMAFCAWLTDRERVAGRLSEDLVYRLPSEAEWEFSARGGGKGRGHRFSGSDTIEPVGWSIINSEQRGHPVKQRKPNELGLYDMSGNMSEWCLDQYIDIYPSKHHDGSPRITGSHDHTRILRGGCWECASWDARVAHRHHENPKKANVYIGFRVVRGNPWINVE